jgi:hypothetical protein
MDPPKLSILILTNLIEAGELDKPNALDWDPYGLGLGGDGDLNSLILIHWSGEVPRLLHQLEVEKSH